MIGKISNKLDNVSEGNVSSSETTLPMVIVYSNGYWPTSVSHSTNDEEKLSRSDIVFLVLIFLAGVVAIIISVFAK